MRGLVMSCASGKEITTRTRWYYTCRTQGAIHRICLALDDREGATACADGSCILWDLQSFRRKTILAAGSSIADACYCTDQSQLVTAGMLFICHLKHHLPKHLLT